MSEEHPAVEAIEQWVEAQYAAGRDGPIPDEEMVSHVMGRLRLEADTARAAWQQAQQ